jgi:hypothetical protein
VDSRVEESRPPNERYQIFWKRREDVNFPSPMVEGHTDIRWHAFHRIRGMCGCCCILSIPITTTTSLSAKGE